MSDIDNGPDRELGIWTIIAGRNVRYWKSGAICSDECTSAVSIDHLLSIGNIPFDVTAKREAIRAGWRESSGKWVKIDWSVCGVCGCREQHDASGNLPECYETAAKNRGEWPEDEKMNKIEKLGRWDYIEYLDNNGVLGFLTRGEFRKSSLHTDGIDPILALIDSELKPQDDLAKKKKHAEFTKKSEAADKKMYSEDEVISIVNGFGGKIDRQDLAIWKKVKSARGLGCNWTGSLGNFLWILDGKWKGEYLLSNIPASVLLGLDDGRAYQWLEDEERWVRIVTKVERV